MGVTYTVQQGDTLSAIAQRAGMDWRQLLALNLDRIKNPNPNNTAGSYNVIFPGTVLRLVGGGAAEVVNPSPAPSPTHPAVIAANEAAVNWNNANAGSSSLWIWALAAVAGLIVIFSD